MTVGIQVIRPRKFQVLNPERTKRNVSRGIRLYLQTLAIEMAKYPPKRNPKGYKRRFILQKGWLDPGAIKMSPDGSSGTLINKVGYAVYAQGPRSHGERTPEGGTRQTARMRRLGWQSITDVARRTRPRFKEVMNRSIKGGEDFQFGVASE